MTEATENSNPEVDVQRIRVRQIRGVAGRTKRTRDTLAALGLGRIGKSREHNVNPALVGMVKAVRHLVEVEKLG